MRLFKSCSLSLVSLPITAIFLTPIVILGVFSALHATGYLHGEARQHLPRFWFFFLATLLSMTGVVFAPGKFTFLLAWEAMGLFSAGLVAFENREKSVRKATWIYFLACHAGACALMLAGVFLCKPGCILAAFLCAIIGFGLKIGFPPFHIWLPEAHPAAPAPASAIMSGAMIPLGFYGLIRFVTPWGQTPTIWGQTPEMFAISGWILLILGIFGSLGGILFALPQVNLKKLLAFSSVENMGIIAMGLGLACLGADPRNVGTDPVPSLALAGALLHVLNHAFLKGGLFLGAGSVLRQTGTLDQDQLGGLMKRMPKTGTFFVLNALGLSGLPPLNGFLSELLIYLAAFQAIKSHQPTLTIAGFFVLIALSLTGGLAAAAYCKAIGATFLGEPRTKAASDATETPKRMWIAQLGLFACSVTMIPGTVLLYMSGMFGDRALTNSDKTLVAAASIGVLLVCLTGALVLLRRFLCPRGQEKSACPTWDCGYHEPTARMAYTATAFTQPLIDLFATVLKPRHHLIPFKGHPATPTDAAFVTETDDRALTAFWRPIFTWTARLSQRAHLLQNGSLHLYIFVVILGVLALLTAAMIGKQV